MGTPRSLLVTVGAAALLFVLLSWVAILAILGVWHTMAIRPDIGTVAAVVIPDTLATRWLFRRIQRDRSRSDARRAATAFAVSALVALAVGYVVGELVGAYAEVIVGRWFIIPAIVVFICALIVIIPSAVVGWVLHPSAGGSPVSESDQE